MANDCGCWIRREPSGSIHFICKPDNCKCGCHIGNPSLVASDKIVITPPMAAAFDEEAGKWMVWPKGKEPQPFNLLELEKIREMLAWYERIKNS